MTEERSAQRSAAPRQEREARIEAETAERQLEAGRMGTWLYKVGTGEVKWSPELEGIHGLAPGSFSGTFDAFQRAIHPDDRDSVVRAIAEAVDRHGNHRIEYRIVLPDGTLRWLEGRGQVFSDRNGRPEYMLGVCSDITERKQDEEERGRLQAHEQASRAELQRASRLNEQFLAMLSHDLRTPLNAIVIWANLLASGSLSPEKARRAVESIVRNARAQAELVQSLLDLSRIVAGALPLNVQHIDLVRVVEAAVEKLRPEMERRGLTLKMGFPTSPITVAGDRDRLQQVFWNLLTDALKLTPDGGRVEIRVATMDSHVQVHLSSNGKALAEHSDRHTYAGLGIGPAIVREIVQAHGGTITADPPDGGQGAAFVVVLPVPPAAASSTDTTPDLRPVARSL